MSSTDKNISSWSPADVQAYLRGELPAREMHQLEKAALDDPFLADALEGLATRVGSPAPDEPLSQDLNELKARLNNRVAEKKQKPVILPWMKIAAAILLLIGLGSTAYFTLVNGKSSTLAKASHQSQPAIPPTTPAAAPATVSNTHPPTPPAARTPAAVASAPPAEADKLTARLGRAKTRLQKTASAAPARPEEGRMPADSMIYRGADSDIAERLSTPPKPALRAVTIRGLRTDTTEYKQLRSDSTATASGEMFVHSNMQNRRSVRAPRNSLGNSLGSQPSLVFSGRVLDAGNHPLPGATLFLKGKQDGYVTDGEGKFHIYVHPQDTVRQLTVTMIGYEEASYALNTTALSGNIIRLQENRSTLDEVVVTGMGIQRKETLVAPPSDEKENLDSFWTKTTPAAGRIAYLDYLASAKKSLAVDSTIRGVESISFAVGGKGELTDFKIERSLSPAHDAGLIHLIMDGPAWKTLRGKKARALVSISFP